MFLIINSLNFYILLYFYAQVNDIYRIKPILLIKNESHKYNSNSLAAVLHMNKSNAAGNSKRLYTPDVKYNHIHLCRK